VTSEPGKGSVFTVRLPGGRAPEQDGKAFPTDAHHVCTWHDSDFPRCPLFGR